MGKSTGEHLQDFSAFFFQHVEDKLYRRCLSRSVRAHKSHDIPFGQSKADIVQLEGMERPGYILQF